MERRGADGTKGVVRNAFLPVSNRGRVTDRAPEDPRLQQKFQRRSDFMSH